MNKSLSQEYREYLEKSKIFQDTQPKEVPLIEKCRELLSNAFGSEAFNKGQFIGRSVVDPIDAKEAIAWIFKTLNATAGDSVATALRDNNLTNKEFAELHAMLAGYLLSLIK